MGKWARDFSTAPGRLTSFSQRSETLTTIFAPGAFITGAGPNGNTVTQGGTSQASPHIAGIAVLAQDLALQTLGRELTFDEFTNVLVSSATTINDGDDEDDNVANTNLDFPLVDVFALGEAILAMAPAISIAANDADKDEGSSGNTSFTFDVTRTGDLSILSTVEYVVTGSGTDAADADDFGGAFPSGVISFAANEATRVISIDVLGDTVFEPNETFTVTLSNPTLGRLGTSDATGTIRNDDADGDSISVSFASSFIIESAGAAATTATVTRTGDTTDALVVGLTNGDDTEIDIPASVTIPAGQTATTFDVDAVDDFTADGTQTVTITAKALGFPDATGSLGVRDNEVNPFVRILPLGGLVSESSTTATLLDGSDQWEFDLFLDAGETLAAVVSPVANELLTVELVSLSAAQTSPAKGDPAIISPQLVTAAGIYKILVSGSGTTDFELKLLRNAATEQQIGEADPGAELAIDNSRLAIGRYAVVGESRPQDTGVSGFTQSNNAAAFIDISGTGTPLNLGDDAMANITTTVGNDIFAAGPVSVANNGGILSGSASQLNFENTTIPTGVFNQALLPFWDDIDSETGNVYWQELQVNGIDTLIVQWDNRPHFDNLGSATFQLQLFASGPLRLRYAYRDVDFGDAGVDLGASATVGFQQSSTSAQQFSFNQAVLANNDVVDYFIETPKDVDEYTVDLTGKAGHTIDIILAARNGADFSGEIIELLATDGTTVLATGSAEPVQAGTAATGYDLGILDFVVPTDGIYTVRFSSETNGEYTIAVTDSLTFNSEPDSATDPLRSLDANQRGLGFVDATNDASDHFTVNLTAGLTATVSTQTVFDSASGSPANSLNPEITIFDSTGAIVVADANSASDGKNAIAVFAVPATGTYRIQVTATSGTGEYIVSATQSVVPALVVDVAADSVAESGGASASTVTITRTSGTTDALDVDLLSSDPGEARIIATVSIPVGESSITVDLEAIDDAILDGAQVVQITATAAGHDSGADTVLVLDDETATATLSASTAGNEEGPIDIVFTVSLDATNETAAPITFNFADLLTGSANVGQDYVAVPNNAIVSVAVGESTGTITVGVTNDVLLESVETVDARITNSSLASVAIGTATATASIIDNETSIADLSVVRQGNETGPVNIQLAVTLDKPNHTGAAITFDLDDLLTGTASSGPDYTAVAANAQLVVAPGATSGSMTIEVLNDGLLEANETVVAQISNSSNSAVSFGVDTVSAIILDDEAATANLAVTTNGRESGPVSIDFTVTLDQTNNTGADLTFELNDLGTGTAISAEDYAAIPAGSLIRIADGAASGTLSVDVVDDAVLENLETLVVQIGNSSSDAVTIGVDTATADIIDNDATTLDLVVTTHGNEEGPVDIVYTIILGAENQTGAAITFDFDDLGTGTAKSGSDYAVVPTDTVLSIGVGETTTTFTVAVVDDLLLESTETLTARISNSSNTSVSFGTATATADIVDNNTSAAVLQVTAHGDEDGPVNIEFTAVMGSQNNTNQPITFDLDDLLTGTATSGLDYSAIPVDAKITIPIGAVSGSFTVNVADDALLEMAETLNVAMSNPSNTAVVIVTAEATATISDNDTASASLSVTTEGNEAGPVDLVFTVTLSTRNLTRADITFDFDDLETGTATYRTDYFGIDASTQIVVPSGEISGSLVVLVNDDDVLESTETVIARISNSSNAAVTVANATAIGTITDNDTADAAVLIAANGNEEGPVDIEFIVALSKSNQTGAAITFDLDDLTTGTAVAGLDYPVIAADAQITIAPGADSGRLVVPVINDTALEAIETVNVQLSNSSNPAVAIVVDAATATIADNDTASASLSATVVGNEAGPLGIEFTVSLSKANSTDGNITFDIADLGTGTATSGLDYTAVAANSQVIIPVGESTGTFIVAVLDDNLLESTETVHLEISNSSNPFATIVTSDTSGSIIDDESTTASLSVAQHGAETGPTSIIYTVTLSEPNNTGAAITFELDDLETGTATSGSDYTAIPADAQLSVAVGESSASFTIDVAEDLLLESTETVVAAISAGSHSGVNLGTTLATATIEDNDSATASFAVFSSGGEVVNTNIVYEVTLSKRNDTGNAITFDFDDLATGTATSAADYDAVPVDAVITVAVGASTGRYSLPIMDDTLLETTETVATRISNSSNATVSITNAEATGTINDNESAVADLAVTTHGAEAGPVDIVFTVSLSLNNHTDADITFDFAELATGTATSGIDYAAVPAGTMVTVPIGSKTGSVTIAVIDDTLLESVETISAEISSSSNSKVTIDQSNASGTISSDDGSVASLAVTTNGSEAGPVDIVYTITLDKTNNTSSPITFDFRDSGSGTATTDLDYTAIPANAIVSIPVGADIGTYTIAVTDDHLLEGTETVAASISNSSNGRVTIAAASAVATISSDETSIADLTVTTHGSEAGPESIVYTVSLDKPNESGAPITFDLSDLATGSAARSLDYTGLNANSRITIRPGDSTGAVSVAVIDDVLLEATETVVLGISNPSLSAVSVGTASASGSISDNESAVANFAVTTNGNETGPVDIIYTVTLNKPNNTGLPIVFDLRDTSAGSATSAEDYAAIAVDAKISIDPGESSGIVTIAVVDDGLLETVETVVVDISNSSNSAVSIGTSSAMASIISNDTATANLSVGSNGTEFGPSDVVFTITLDKTNNTDSVITFDLDDLATGTALTGVDYSSIAADAVISVPIGSNSGSIVVGVIDDVLLESTESISVEVSNSSNGDVTFVSSTATAQIVDDETAVANLVVASQGAEEGPMDIVYTVTLDKTNNTDATITFDFADLGIGSAASGIDYTAIAVDAVFSVVVGANEATLQVPVTDDGLLESLETVVAEISNSNNPAVTIGNAIGMAEIADNDTAFADLSVLNHGEEAGPVDITVLVSLSSTNHTGGDITFDLADLLTGSAVSGVDYAVVAADATIIIPDGSDAGTFSIGVVDDELLETDETVNLGLANSSFASVLLGTTSATASINSDEQAVADLSVTRHGAEAGSTAIELTVTLDLVNDTGDDITIDVADVGSGTATAGIDYVSLPAGSQFTIAAGSDTATLTVGVTDDVALESTETMVAEISKSSTSLVSLGNVSVLANITDNETATANLTATTDGDEDGLVSIVFTVTLDTINQSDSAITFDLADTGFGTAAAGLDYSSLAPTTQVVIPVGGDSAEVTIDVLDDSLVELAETVVTTLTNSSNAAVSIGSPTASASIASDDIAGFATTETSGSTRVTEAGSSDSFDFVLNAEPQSDVVFSVVSQDLTEVNATPATITFTQANWNIAQTVTVTGVDDTSPDGGQSTRVTISVDSGNSDPLFASVGSQFVNVLTSDDEPGRLDVDLNGNPDATTDGILIVRYLFSFTGDALIRDAVGNSATNTTAESIIAALMAAPELLDVDGNGSPDATTDGILIVRYLFGFRGDALVQDVIGSGAVRTTGTEVKAYLDGFMPAASGGFGTTGSGGVSSGGLDSGDGGKAGNDSASRQSNEDSSPAANAVDSIDIAVTESDSGGLLAVWTNVSSADAYRVFIQPMEGNGFIRRIDTTDSQRNDLRLPAGGYRMWVEAVNLNSGEVVASGAVEFVVAETNDEFEALTSLQFALVEMSRTTEAAEIQEPNMQPAAALIEAVSNDEHDSTSESQNGFVAPTAFDEEHDYLHSDSLMEVWMSDGLWID